MAVNEVLEDKVVDPVADPKSADAKEPVAAVEPKPDETPAKPDDKKPEDEEEDPLLQKTREGLAEWRARLTREAQEVSKSKKELEERMSAIEEREKAIQAKAPTSDPASEFPVKPLELFDTKDIDPNDPLQAADLEDLKTWNQTYEAINGLVSVSKDTTTFVNQLYTDLVVDAAEREFERCQRALSAKYDGILLTWEQFVKANANAPDWKKDDAFAYRCFKQRTDDLRTSIIEGEIGPELIKRLEDKVREDKEAKAKAKDTPPTPPATVTTPVNTTPTDKAAVDWTKPEAVREYLDGK